MKENKIILNGGDNLYVWMKKGWRFAYLKGSPEKVIVWDIKNNWYGMSPISFINKCLNDHNFCPDKDNLKEVLSNASK
ncbi:hypothetical protein ACL9Z5_000541 [Acinetobacter calcoaceticus]|uniref:hypothetical protein n=1 Tax=Acinetobacter pittii TaxID=48296 RepID=UPI003BA182BE